MAPAAVVLLLLLLAMAPAGRVGPSAAPSAAAEVAVRSDPLPSVGLFVPSDVRKESRYQTNSHETAVEDVGEVSLCVGGALALHLEGMSPD